MKGGDDNIGAERKREWGKALGKRGKGKRTADEKWVGDGEFWRREGRRGKRGREGQHLVGDKGVGRRARGGIGCGGPRGMGVAEGGNGRTHGELRYGRGLDRGALGSGC